MTVLEAHRVNRRLQEPVELEVKQVSQYCNHLLLKGCDSFIAKKHLAFRRQLKIKKRRMQSLEQTIMDARISQ